MNESTRHVDIPGRSRTLRHVFLFWGGYALMLAGSGALSGMVPRNWQKVLLPTWQLMVFGPVMTVGAIALTVLLVRRDKISLEDVGVGLRPSSPMKFGIGFLVGLLLVALNLAIVSLITGLRLTWSPEAGFAATIITLASYFFGSCGEELGFRGYPLRRLERVLGLWSAQAIVAVAFAIYHIWVGWPWMNALVGTGTGSLLFGMAAIASRGLALPIGLHAAWGFGGWVVGGGGSPGFWKTVSQDEGASGGEVSLSYLAVAGVGILAFTVWRRRNQRRDSKHVSASAAANACATPTVSNTSQR